MEVELIDGNNVSGLGIIELQKKKSERHSSQDSRMLDSHLIERG
jgi:hypothetical protein